MNIQPEPEPSVDHAIEPVANDSEEGDVLVTNKLAQLYERYCKEVREVGHGYLPENNAMADVLFSFAEWLLAEAPNA